MDRFAIISNAYKNALRTSDFKNARQFLNIAAIQKNGDSGRYKKVTVLDYKVNRFAVSADRLEIRQQAEIEYYLSDRPILRKMVDQQHWKYHAEREIWLLQTGLPAFDLGK